jgi:predicted ferric reductase
VWADDPLLHLSRAAGLAAYLALWLDMCLGLTLTATLSMPYLRRWRAGDLHQFTALLGLGLLGTHIAVLPGLQQQPFGLADLLIPMSRAINPVAPLLGISSLYIVVMVSAVSYARRYVGLRLWRLIHLLSFAAFAMSFAHAIVAGPDGSILWVRGLYVATAVILAFLILTRFLRTGSSRRLQPAPLHSENSVAIVRE